MSELTDFVSARLAEEEAELLGDGLHSHERELVWIENKRRWVENALRLETTGDPAHLRGIAFRYQHHPDFRSDWLPTSTEVGIAAIRVMKRRREQTRSRFDRG